MPRLMRLGLPKIWMRLLDQASESIDQASLRQIQASQDGKINTQTDRQKLPLQEYDPSVVAALHAFN